MSNGFFRSQEFYSSPVYPFYGTVLLYDVIIVGAGPAGATAGKWCALKGLKTVIVEKHRLPRPKICAGGLTASTIQIIDEPLPDNIIERRISGYDFLSPNMGVAKLRSVEPIGVTVYREYFDKFLIDQALSSGSELEEGKPVVDVKVEEHLVKCRLSSGRILKAQLVVDASGVAGIVARKIGMQGRAKIILLSFEKDLKVDFEKSSQQFNPSILECYFTKENLGYGWVFPRSRSVSIGFSARVDNKVPPYKGFMNFCRMLTKLKKIEFQMEPFNALAIPTAGDPMEAVSYRTILTGDAAGFTDPFSGEGIQYAMKSGKNAAIAASNAFKEEDFSESYLQQHYSRTCEKEFAKGLRFALKFSTIFHKHIDLFINILNDGAQELWLENSQGKLTYKTLEERFVRGLPVWLIQTYWKRLREQMRFAN